MIIFGIIAAAASGLAGYRYYTINHIDDRLDKLYAKEDEINDAMEKTDEKYAAEIDALSGPYDTASAALDDAWTRYYDVEAYNTDLNDLIDRYGEEEEESTEEEEESTEEEEEVVVTPSQPAAETPQPEPAPQEETTPPASNPVPPDLDLLDSETYIETDAEGRYIIYDSDLDEYGYYDEDGAWWTLENYVPPNQR